MAAQLAYTPRSDPEPDRQPFYRRRPCPHCAGSGVTDAPLTPYCSHHGVAWSAARISWRDYGGWTRSCGSPQQLSEEERDDE